MASSSRSTDHPSLTHPPPTEKTAAGIRARKGESVKLDLRLVRMLLLVCEYSSCALCLGNERSERSKYGSERRLYAYVKGLRGC
jgi:hypothetical protein